MTASRQASLKRQTLEAPADNSLTVAAYTLGMTNFDQSKHPRNAAGTSAGGQFAQKQNSAPEVALASDEVNATERVKAVMGRFKRQVEKVFDAQHQAAIGQATIVIEAIRDICAIRYPGAVTVEYVWDDVNEDYSLTLVAVRDAQGNELLDSDVNDDELGSLKPFDSYYYARYCRGMVAGFYFDQENDLVEIDLR